MKILPAMNGEPYNGTVAPKEQYYRGRSLRSERFCRRRGGVAVAQRGALRQGAGAEGAVPDRGSGPHGPVRRQGCCAAVNRMVAYFKRNLALAKAKDARAVAAE